MKHKILIADEDENTLSKLENSLISEGYNLIPLKNGKEVLNYARRNAPDLMILEVMLPGVDGFTICKTLRVEGHEIPIVFLTHRTSEIDAVIGLGLGAQDYIRKPLYINELMVRVSNILSQEEHTKSCKTIVLNDLEIDYNRYEVKYKGQNLELTPKEFKLLTLLAKSPNRVFSREELLVKVWGFSPDKKTRTVDMHIGSLRQKIEENPSCPRLLKSIRSIGYTLCSN